MFDIRKEEKMEEREEGRKDRRKAENLTSSKVKFDSHFDKNRAPHSSNINLFLISNPNLILNLKFILHPTETKMTSKTLLFVPSTF